MLTASVLLSVALTLQPDSGLRLVNPHPVPVETKLRCDHEIHQFRMPAHGVNDLAVEALCTSPQLESTLPLLTLETAGDAEQRITTDDENCPPIAMSAPLFACERGIATASVPLYENATYSWTAENATITTSTTDNRVTVSLGESATAKLVCVITRGECSTEAVGIIAIRKPLVIHEMKVPLEAEVAAPLTITWSYAGDVTPGAQLLTGDALTQPVQLSADKRSYTFTPAMAGTRSIELNATLAPTIRTPKNAPKGKHRAVGATLAMATQCPSAKMVRQVHLGGCALATPQIAMPEEVEAGSSFMASVEVAAGDSVSWAVTNGTILTPDYLPQVEVRANDNETPMVIKVVVTRGLDCAATASELMTVRPRASCASAPPTAALTIAGRNCDHATTIQATFTGTPPFRGMWFDGTTFETSSYTITRNVSTLGTFTISNFRDATCSGIVTQKAKVESVKPTVVLSTVNGETCATPNTKIVATFSGTPPFTGEWNDGVKFTTNEYQLVRETPTPWTFYIHALRDATCPNVAEASNFLTIDAPTHVSVEEETACQFSPGAFAYPLVHFYGGEPPYRIEWSDGTITTHNSKGSVSVPFNTSLPLAEYRIVRATARGCSQLNILNDTARVALRPPVTIDTATTDIVFCGTAGNTGTAKLVEGTAAGDPLIEWSMEGGTIVSGQGTREITFQSDPATVREAKLSVRTQYADGSCNTSSSNTIFVMGEPAIDDLKLGQNVIKAGAFTDVTFTWESDIEWLQMDVSNAARREDLLEDGFNCVNRKCSVSYHDTHGPGTVTILVFYGGECNLSPGKVASVTLTIEP